MLSSLQPSVIRTSPFTILGLGCYFLIILYIICLGLDRLCTSPFQQPYKHGLQVFNSLHKTSQGTTPLDISRQHTTHNTAQGNARNDKTRPYIDSIISRLLQLIYSQHEIKKSTRLPCFVFSSNTCHPCFLL